MARTNREEYTSCFLIAITLQEGSTPPFRNRDFSSRDMRSQKQVLQRITGNDFVDLVGIGSRVSRINFKKNLIPRVSPV